MSLILRIEHESVYVLFCFYLVIQVIIAFFHEVFYESFVAMDRYEPLFTQTFVPVNRGGADRPCRR